MNDIDEKELSRLLSRQIERYGSERTEPMTAELAQSIFMSIEYCMNSYYKALEDPQPYEFVKRKKRPGAGADKMDQIFEKGVIAVKGCMSACRQLLKRIQEAFIPVVSDTYEKTIYQEIPQFLEKYDPRYQAQISPVSLSYPLANEVELLTGIEYLYEYLYHIQIENELLSKLSFEGLERFSQVCFQDSLEEEVNLYERCIGNIIGARLLGKQTKQLILLKEDAKVLYQYISDKSIAGLTIECEKKVEDLILELKLTSKDSILYLKETSKMAAYRFSKASKWEDLYNIITLEEKNKIQGQFEGKPLIDTKLRQVIDEINQLRYLKDKLQTVKEEIHSLFDLKEVLKECFAGEEYTKVFDLLLPSEKELLLSQAKKNLEYYSDETLLNEWERTLIDESMAEVAAGENKETGDAYESRNGI